TLAGSYMFPSYMDVVDDWSHADFFVGITRHGCDKEMNGEEMFEISRSDVAFAVVKDVRPKTFHSVELGRSERRG
ncbi:MAG: hypothetical protein K2Q10_07075, partial [Rhodospirillales bacterium]|nr:hypothetical protein [Rhodospirillales bacterium]